jgi:hypothetical protein
VAEVRDEDKDVILEIHETRKLVVEEIEIN